MSLFGRAACRVDAKSEILYNGTTHNQVIMTVYLAETNDTCIYKKLLQNGNNITSRCGVSKSRQSADSSGNMGMARGTQLKLELENELI